ncbi:MAG: uracil-DNA glycosylase [Actinomycetaceae bacterium]|nr:uracil-DNA glycosylase [Actinomycetaceae bacterium]
MTAKPLTDLIDEGWARALAPVEPLIHELGEMLREENRAGRGYLPAGTDVLRAFTYPFDDVKVLIIGQDPYPTPGHAMGLSFSVMPGVKPPRSLQNIYQELNADLGLPVPDSGDLTPWAREGVCLMNRVLTVMPGTPGSHRGRGWEQVTEVAIRALVARNLPLVSILWGRDARSVRPLLGSTPVIESAHPSPLSASRGFFGSRPFSRANAALLELGTTPVNWDLTAGK